MIHRLLVATLLVVALGALAPAQSFNFPNFASTSGLSLNGSTVPVNNALRLTASTNQTGTCFHQVPFPVLAGFDTTFTFRILFPPGAILGEGMSFVIHDDPLGPGIVGGTIWGLGYGTGANAHAGIRNGLAVELDTFQDGFLGDTSANELSVHTRGALGNRENESFSIGRTTPATNLSNGQTHTMRVQYVPGMLRVYVNDLVNPLLTIPYDLVSGGTYVGGAPVGGLGLTNGVAWVGFTAATGSGILHTTEIQSWTWTSTPLLHPCFAGTVGAGSGGPYDVLTIDGSAGGPFRTVQVSTGQPFTFAVAQPPSATLPCPFLIFGTLGIPDGSAAQNLGVGTLCFPVAFPQPAGTFTLANSAYPDPAALLAAMPTPWMLPIPAGGILSPLTVTFQGVLGENNGGPLTLSVTNAISLGVVAGPPPTITSVNPLSTTPGAQVSVNGADFVSGLTVAINGAPVPATLVGPTLVTFPYPPGIPCDATLVLTNPDGQSVSNPLNPTPVVTGSPNPTGRAAGGTLFIMIGSGFSLLSTVTIGGAGATVVTASNALMIVSTPPGTAGPAPVVITTPGGCQATTTFTYF